MERTVFAFSLQTATPTLSGGRGRNKSLPSLIVLVATFSRTQQRHEVSLPGVLRLRVTDRGCGHRLVCFLLSVVVRFRWRLFFF